ncbi:MAG: hypothetical protein IH623_05960 [Verrucomicrobia bacterium]|nr:hypothetical protein [Verrucomicrobiota bacterium]
MSDTRHILNRLAAADRAHQKEVGGRFLLRSVKFLCAFVLGAFVLDVTLRLDPGWRLAMLLVLVAGVIALACVGWYLAYVRRNRLEHIARFLEGRYETLGSQLINLLQLQEQVDDPALAPLTRELARQAVENYEGGLREAPIERLARTDALRRHSWRAAWALLIFCGVLAAFFRVSVIEIARFIDPFGDHPPYSFTRLEIVDPGPAGTNVLYGKGLVVKVKSSGHPPSEVFITAHPPAQPEQAVTLPMFDQGRAGFNQILDNVRTELVVFAHTKDRHSLSRQVRVGVVLTPQLEKAFVQVTPPAYTGLNAAEKAYAFKGVQALQGSEVRFRLQSNRPLRDGLVEISAADEPPQRVTLTKSAEHEVSGRFVARESGRLHFSIVDVAGIPSQGECEGALTVTYDLPPEVRIGEPERDAFVAMDFKLTARVEASDDYGLRQVRFHRGLNGVYSAPRISAYDTVVRSSAETSEFHFSELGVQPGDVISMFAEAVDTAPEPHLSRSQIVRLMVISVEDYNDFLRAESDIADAQAKYESLQDDLRELIEEQKKLAAEAEKLKAQLAKAAADKREPIARDLDALLAKQNELNHKLNRHAERMENFVRQTPLYDVERELQEMLNQEAQVIRDSAGDNNATAGDIAQRSSPPDGPRRLTPEMLEEFKRAADEQIARLGGSQEETEKRVVQTLQDMSAMQELLKDFNQFEMLYRAQQELASQAQAYDRAGMLTREDQLALKELAATEKQVADLLAELQDRLRDDADAAEKLFPKAAKSGRFLADKIEEMRMTPLARQAMEQMLAGNGEKSYALAERLRSEMGKLFSDCQGGNCPSGDELDGFLSLQRQMKPGNSFAQMSQSRKFGRPGNGQPFGKGEGSSGSSGYAVMDGSKLSVMGNEFSPSRGDAKGRQSARTGTGAGRLAGSPDGAQTDEPDAIKGLNPVNRQSGAVISETALEEYNEIVENYFRTITTRKP